MHRRPKQVGISNSLVLRIPVDAVLGNFFRKFLTQMHLHPGLEPTPINHLSILKVDFVMRKFHGFGTNSGPNCCLVIMIGDEQNKHAFVQSFADNDRR